MVMLTQRSSWMAQCLMISGFVLAMRWRYLTPTRRITMPRLVWRRVSLTVVSLTYLRFNSRLCELEVLGLLSSSYRARLAFGFNVVLWRLLLSACGAGLDPKYIEQGMPQNLSE